MTIEVIPLNKHWGSWTYKIQYKPKHWHKLASYIDQAEAQRLLDECAGQDEFYEAFFTEQPVLQGLQDPKMFTSWHKTMIKDTKKGRRFIYEVLTASNEFRLKSGIEGSISPLILKELWDALLCNLPEDHVLYGKLED